MTELTVNPTQMTQLINTHTEVSLCSYYKSLPYCRRRYQIFLKCWMKIENGIAGNWRSNAKVKKSTKLPRHFTFLWIPTWFQHSFSSRSLIIFLGEGEWLKKWRPICCCQSFLAFFLIFYDGSLFARVDLHNGNPSIRWNARAPIVIGVYIHHRNEFPFYWFPLVTFRFLPNEKLNERADDGRRMGWSNSKRIHNVSNRNDVQLAAKPSIAFACVVNSFRPPITTSAPENLLTLSQSRKCAENVSHHSSFVSFFYDQNGRDRHSAARRPVTSKIPVSSSEDWPFCAGICWSLSRPSRYYIVPRYSQCSRRRVHWCLYPTYSFHHAIPTQ